MPITFTIAFKLHPFCGFGVPPGHSPAPHCAGFPSRYCSPAGEDACNSRPRRSPCPVLLLSPHRYTGGSWSRCWTATNGTGLSGQSRFRMRRRLHKPPKLPMMRLRYKVLHRMVHQTSTSRMTVSVKADRRRSLKSTSGRFVP